MNKKLLFVLWGVLFVLTAGLGFLPEAAGWMTALSLLFFLPPALLNYDQPGMFWGGRHFLDIVPLLCILSVHLLLRTGEQLSRAVRTGGWLLVILSLAANVSGYAVLNAKRNFSAEYVREMAKPGYQVILTDMYWMPEELAWIHREKCAFRNCAASGTF